MSLTWSQILNTGTIIYRCTSRGMNRVLSWLFRANSNHVIAAFTALLFIANCFFVYYARQQWKKMEEQRGVMQGQLCEMQKDREASNRPWIAVERIDPGDLYYEHDNKPKFGFVYYLKNFGHSPANVKLFANFVQLKGNEDETIWFNEAGAVCRDGLDDFGKDTKRLWTIFPGTTMPYIHPTYSGDKINSGVKFAPLIMGCVIYAPTAAVDSGGPHQTPFLMHLSMKISSAGDRPRLGQYIPITFDWIKVPKEKMVVIDILHIGRAN